MDFASMTYETLGDTAAVISGLAILAAIAWLLFEILEDYFLKKEAKENIPVFYQCCRHCYLQDGTSTHAVNWEDGEIAFRKDEHTVGCNEPACYEGNVQIPDGIVRQMIRDRS